MRCILFLECVQLTHFAPSANQFFWWEVMHVWTHGRIQKWGQGAKEIQK